VTKELLDITEVGAGVEEVGREAVTKLVRVYRTVKTRAQSGFVEDPPRHAFVKASTARTDKDPGRRLRRLGHEVGAGGKPRVKGGHTPFVYGDKPSLLAFAEDTNPGGVGRPEGERVDGEATGLADPEPGGVDKLKQGLIAVVEWRASLCGAGDEIDGRGDVEDVGERASLSWINKAIHG